MKNTKFIVAALVLIAIFALTPISKYCKINFNVTTNGINLSVETNAPSDQR